MLLTVTAGTSISLGPPSPRRDALTRRTRLPKEGRDAWQGKGRCAPNAAATVSAGAEADACGNRRPGRACCTLALGVKR